ncbi:MAG: hypothetical protein ACTSP1_19505, partial [Candidatus Freyarchaeota archaeon]
EAFWQLLLTHPDTVYLLEYLSPNWRSPEEGKPIIPPPGPIINVKIKDDTTGNFGYESQKFLLNFFRILELTFRPRSSGSKQYSGYSRAQLASLIGKHHRDLAKLADIYPDVGVDRALSVFIVDHSSMFVDPTTGLVYLLDDKEQPKGFWDFGVTVQTSLIRYGDRDGGFIDQTFIIKNDPLTCWARKTWLEQVDSRGNPIVTEERLIRLGLGYRVKVGNNYLFKSCIDYETGEITELVLWDMGVNPNTLEPVKVIDLTPISECAPFEQKFDTGVHDWDRGTFQKTGEAVIWGKRTPNHDKYVLNLLRENINYLLPESTHITSPNRVWFIPFRRIKGYFLDSLCNNLMLWFGVNPALQRKTQQEWERSTRPTIIQINTIAKLLNGMGLTHKPFSFDEVKNIIGQTFVEQSFEAYLEYGRRINHKGQIVGSDRYALEMLLKSGVAMVDPSGGDNRTKPILTHFGADAVTFAQDTHPASSLPRGNIPLFKIHTDKFKDKNGNPLLPEYIKPDKNGYVFCGGDVAASEEKGKAVIFVPIFKNEGPISHENNPNDLIIRRTDIETSVPIESKMEKFWASIDKYAVFTYQNGEYTPLLKPQESTNIYPESEYTPIDYNETLHLLGILENLCTIISTHSSSEETETNIKTLTPAHLFSELKGLLVDNPKKALKL